MSLDQEIKDAIHAATGWEAAVDRLIDMYTVAGRAFSSGEITTAIRIHQPAMRFRHGGVCERISDRWHGEKIRYGDVSAVQVPRVCEGVGRTPAGTTVFVYAAEEDEAIAHPFEIDIPKPGQAPQKMPVLPAPNPTPTVAPNLPSQAEMIATVEPDARLCIPKKVVDALLHATGFVLRGGDPLWIRFESDKRTVISLDYQPGSVKYDIARTRGQVLFPKLGGKPFVPGETFSCELQNKELVVEY